MGFLSDMAVVITSGFFIKFFPCFMDSHSPFGALTDAQMMNEVHFMDKFSRGA